MTSGAATAMAKLDLCLVDNHRREHDCRRVQVDFPVQLQLQQTAYAARAVEMCAAGITLSGHLPASLGDQIELRIAFPGRSKPMEASGVVRQVNDGSIRCEYWAANSYEQQFLDSFVSACARRQELRKNGCEHRN
jgi:hypothetical protein